MLEAVSTRETPVIIYAISQKTAIFTSTAVYFASEAL
jgi:hypothetical protein